MHGGAQRSWAGVPPRRRQAARLVAFEMRRVGVVADEEDLCRRPLVELVSMYAAAYREAEARKTLGLLGYTGQEVGDEG